MDRPTSVARTNGIEQLDQAVRSERAFLALCIALPDAGARLLFEIDPDRLFTSEVMRRAARHLVGRTRTPLSDLPADDEQLARALADLVTEAGRERVVREDELEHARLVLDEARLDRAIHRARERGGADIPDLAREREAVREARRAVTGRLERAV